MSLLKVLTDEMEKVRVQIAENLDRKGLTNTGATKQSLKVEVTETSERIVGILKGNANLSVLEGGAKPITKKTTGQYIESITKWGQSKLGLSQKEATGLAFAMLNKRLGDGRGGRTVRADGTYFVPNPFNPGGVLSDAVNEQTIKEIRGKLIKEAARVIVEGIEVERL
jgi:hypothetical protein